MTDKKSKKIGLRAATRIVAFEHVTGQAKRIRIRRTRHGVHLAYDIGPNNELRVTSFVPREKLKIKLAT